MRAKVRAGPRRSRSFYIYEKPTYVKEGREDFRSFVTQVVLSDNRFQAPASFALEAGDLSLLS